MLGVGQSTIFEHHIVSGKFLLKFGCIAVFIYQNDYYNRLYSHLYHIYQKSRYFKVDYPCKK